MPYLLTRWNAGHTNIAALVSELRELGYRGSPNNVYRFLRPYQASKPSAPPVLPPPKPRIRAVTSWITRNPDTLPDAETGQLTTILTGCPELAATRAHVGAFAVLMRDRRGDRIPEWIANVRADDLPPPHQSRLERSGPADRSSAATRFEQDQRTHATFIHAEQDPAATRRPARSR